MPGHMQQRGPSTWRLHAFAGKDSNGRKRYTSRTFHGTKKEAGIALAAFVTEVAKDRERIVAGRVDHRVADAQQMAELKEGSAVPRHNRPISSRDQARRTGPWLDARLSTTATPHRRPLQRAVARDSRGHLSGRSTGHFANHWPGLTGVATSRSSPPTASSFLRSGPERWNRHPPTTYAR